VRRTAAVPNCANASSRAHSSHVNPTAPSAWSQDSVQRAEKGVSLRAVGSIQSGELHTSKCSSLGAFCSIAGLPVVVAAKRARGCAARFRPRSGQTFASYYPPRPLSNSSATRLGADSSSSGLALRANTGQSRQTAAPCLVPDEGKEEVRWQLRVLACMYVPDHDGTGISVRGGNRGDATFGRGLSSHATGAYFQTPTLHSRQGKPGPVWQGARLPPCLPPPGCPTRSDVRAGDAIRMGAFSVT
jgi:hypothetical protein